jgi:hypothetical protein
MLMGIKSLKVMEPKKLMVIGSTQERLMKKEKEKKEMGRKLILRVTILRIYK